MEFFFKEILCDFYSWVYWRLGCSNLWVLFLIKYLGFLYHIVNIVLQIPYHWNFLDRVLLYELDDLKLDLRRVLMHNFVVFFHFLYHFFTFLLEGFILLPQLRLHHGLFFQKLHTVFHILFLVVLTQVGELLEDKFFVLLADLCLSFSL